MASARPSLRPTLRLDVLDQLPTPQQEGDVRAHFAGGSWESQHPVGEPTGNAERRPRVRCRQSLHQSRLCILSVPVAPGLPTGERLSSHRPFGR
jgi:hypothetical protein